MNRDRDGNDIRPPGWTEDDERERFIREREEHFRDPEILFLLDRITAARKAAAGRVADDIDPIPDRPWEPPGPFPGRKLTERGRWFVVIVIVGVAFLALTLLVLVPSKYGVSPG